MRCDLRANAIVLVSGKGGVGKSTLAFALADLIARSGSRGALVDLDPQAGATRLAGLEPSADPISEPPVRLRQIEVWRSGRSLAEASADALRARLENARSSLNVVVLDLSSSLHDQAHGVVLQDAASSVISSEQYGAIPDLMLVVARCDIAGLASAVETTSMAEAAGAPWRLVPTFGGKSRYAREAESLLRQRFGEKVTQV